MKVEEQKQKIAKKVLQEASSRLKNAVDKLGLNEINITNAMLAGY